jgi:hypothetical protein
VRVASPWAIDGMHGATHPRVRRIGTGGSLEMDKLAVDLWRQRSSADKAAGIYLHPEMLSWAEGDGTAPIAIYTGGANGSETRSFTSLAVLSPKRLKIPLVPGTPWEMDLTGLRLLEDRLLGDDGEPAMVEFVETLAGMLRAGEADFVLFQDVDAHAPLRKVLKRSGGRLGASLWEPHPPSHHWWIRFPEPPETYWRQFSKKTRYNFRYRAKRLEHTCLRVNRPGQVQEFLEKAGEVTRRTWQYQKLGLGLGGVLYNRDFWEQVAAMGAMRCYLLQQDDRPLAFAMGIQWHGRYVYEETGYDPAYAEFSPGQVLLWRMIEDLIAEDCPQQFDFGFGDADYKQLFANHMTLSGPLILARRGLRLAVGMALDQLHRCLSRSGRAALRRLGLLTLLRRKYRR